MAQSSAADSASTKRDHLPRFPLWIWFGSGLAIGLTQLAIRAALMNPMIRFHETDILRFWLAPIVPIVLMGSLGLVWSMTTFVSQRVFHPVTPYLYVLAVVLLIVLEQRSVRFTHALILAIGVAVWLGPWLASGSRRFFRWSFRVSLAMGVVWLTVLSLQFARSNPRLSDASNRPLPPDGSPNILLIVMDTVRAESTSLVANPKRDVTPRLADWAKRGVVFERAIAPAPWTLPSHAAMFTGRWPHELDLAPDRGLDRRFPTLAERLSQFGYATGGIVANHYYCHRRVGIHRGFDYYDDQDTTFQNLFFPQSYILYRFGVNFASVLEKLGFSFYSRSYLDKLIINSGERRSANQVSGLALDWIDQHRERPWFLFLNLFDAHGPYILPQNVNPRFAAAPKTSEEIDELNSWGTLTSPPTASLANRMLDHYESCIAYLDEQLDLFLSELQGRGQLDNCVVIITSDHGEHFGEHTVNGTCVLIHGNTLYQQEVHVPLMVIAPGRIAEGTRVTNAVSLRDLPATILRLIDPKLKHSFPGQTLTRFLDTSNTVSNQESPSASDVLTEMHYSPLFFRNVQMGITEGVGRAVVGEGWSYLANPDRPDELYDLTNDPREQTNLIDSENESTRRMLQRRRNDLKRLVPQEHQD